VQSLPSNPAISPLFNDPATVPRQRAIASFGPGFEIMTEDEEYILQFHDLTQLDFRGYTIGGQRDLRDAFLFPRQWLMWNGRVTREIGYFVSIANAFDTMGILDCFVDFAYDSRFQLRMGRYKTPFTYEFFVEPVQGLIVPERSLFFNNFGQNRDAGIMAYGRVFGNTLDYATGIFNANRNGTVAVQNGKWVSGFFNWHPFDGYSDSILANFNFGGSVFAGNNLQPALPIKLRTVVPTSGNDVAGIPFLALKDNAYLAGPMVFWDMHLAWFYQQLAVIGEWQSGYQDYALQTSLQKRTKVPVQSFYVTAGYLLTGETRSSVGIVKPNRPFSLRPGQFGPGAWEVFGRFDFMDVGNQIYTGGIADPIGNSNRLWMTDTGLTWHITQYIKMFFDWNHVEFNDRVLYNTHKAAGTQNLLWWRLQLFF